MKFEIKNKFWFCFFIILSFILLKCASLQELIKVEKPHVNIQQVRFVDINFNSLGLAFDVNIKNPNPLSINLAKFNYDLLINEISFLKGQNNNPMSIESQGESTVEIPISLDFKNLYQTYNTLKNSDSTSYKINCGFSFDLPILGVVNIPVSKTGEIPLIKLPKIKINKLQLKNLNLTGADLELELLTENPNAFQLFVNNINYDFKINNQSWAKGISQKQVAIQKNNENTIQIPISLNFAQMGMGLYQAIINGQSLNYDFQGALDLKTSLPILKQVNLPIDSSGQLNITR